MPGPVPKRKEERRRRNKAEPGQEITTITSPVEPIKAPPGRTTWCLSAKTWYKSLATSGQAQFYEDSDWAQAQWIADLMTKVDKQAAPSSAVLAVIQKGMSELLTSEGARRRARVEITKPKENAKKASVSTMNKYRDAAG